MKKNEYHFNSQIGFLEIDPSYLDSGLLFAKMNMYQNIRIISLNHESDTTYTIDFSPFKDLLFIKKLIIDDNFRIIKIDNIACIETLTSLSYLELNTAISINLSSLIYLEGLSIKNDKVIWGLNNIPNLKYLQILSSQYENLVHINQMNYLDELILNGGKIKSLNGIPSCNKLKLLNCRYLTDIEAIGTIELKKLYIERCNKIKDLSFLQGNKFLREIFIDNISSLDFLTSLNNLEKFTFWNCIDGNLKPLLECSNLRDIYFYPNKRHYTHSLKDILILTSLMN